MFPGHLRSFLSHIQCGIVAGGERGAAGDNAASDCSATSTPLAPEKNYQFRCHHKNSSMAAVVIMKRRMTVSTSHTGNSEQLDRDDELLAEIRNEQSEKKSAERSLDMQLQLSPDSLMGKMPKGEKILKSDILMKYSSDNEWKPVRVAMTAVGVFMSKPGEELLRDMIPLYEVLDVKKKQQNPDESSESAPPQDSAGRRLKISPTFKNLRVSSLIGDRPSSFHDSNSPVIQIRTVEDGYNSGKMYLLRAPSDESSTSWVLAIRAAAHQAVMLKQAGPGLLRKLQFRVRRLYRGVVAQIFVAALIFLSFLANILQTELLASDPDGPLAASYARSGAPAARRRRGAFSCAGFRCEIARTSRRKALGYCRRCKSFSACCEFQRPGRAPRASKHIYE